VLFGGLKGNLVPHDYKSGMGCKTTVVKLALRLGSGSPTVQHCG
jgi:hypothetical protein